MTVTIVSGSANSPDGQDLTFLPPNLLDAGTLRSLSAIIQDVSYLRERSRANHLSNMEFRLIDPKRFALKVSDAPLNRSNPSPLTELPTVP